MAITSTVVGAVVGIGGLIGQSSARSDANRARNEQIDNAEEQARAQAEYDKREAEAAKEEAEREAEAAREAQRQADERARALEEQEQDRIDEEARQRAEQERMEQERFDEEKAAVWSEYGLEAERLAKESDTAALQAEEEIDASRLRTQQAQKDIARHEELVIAAQTAGFASRGIAPGSDSALAVMKRSSDLALDERMKLQENFNLFASTRRGEAQRVKESGDIALSHLGSRIELASGKGRTALRHMRERGELAADASEFSLRQFQESNTRELEFASRFMEMDIETARRKGEAADRAIAAIDENQQYVSTGYGIQRQSINYSERYNTLGMITGVAGGLANMFSDLNQQGFFTTPKNPFFANLGQGGIGSGTGSIE